MPAVTSLSPDRGPASGGTTVTLKGRHLTGTTAVTFDCTAAGGQRLHRHRDRPGARVRRGRRHPDLQRPHPQARWTSPSPPRAAV
ncbi:IPT/TIG domain-containing protein [Kitasatospora griseola]|uniref:IPT/TIG domain-containing protein n=1 Tax=Kitasatospora griseola TaxID=2064 RepID=UPI00382740BE